MLSRGLERTLRNTVSEGNLAGLRRTIVLITEKGAERKPLTYSPPPSAEAFAVLQEKGATLAQTADLALLGVLNSRLALLYFKSTCAALEGAGEAYLRFFGQYLEGFPVRLPELGGRSHGRLVELVETMLSLQERLATLRGEHQKTVLQRQIAATDRQIDRLVYDLYGLTAEEIATVEAATA